MASAGIARLAHHARRSAAKTSRSRSASSRLAQIAFSTARARAPAIEAGLAGDRHLRPDPLELARHRLVIGLGLLVVRIDLERRAEILHRLGRVALLQPELAARVEDVGERGVELQERGCRRRWRGRPGRAAQRAPPRAISALIRSAFAVFSLSITAAQAAAALSMSSAAVAARHERDIDLRHRDRLAAGRRMGGTERERAKQYGT